MFGELADWAKSATGGKRVCSLGLFPGGPLLGDLDWIYVSGAMRFAKPARRMLGIGLALTRL